MTLEQLAPILAIISRSGLSVTQIQILLAAQKGNGSATMTDLARAACHTTAAATGAVDVLERRSYLLRNNGTADRRKVLVRLTEPGHHLLKLLSDSIKKLPVN